MKKISLLVSKNCFGNCQGCYLDPKQGRELSTKEVSTLAQLLKDAKYKGITLSGGDPLFRKDIMDIINIFYHLDFNIHLDTTGTSLLDKEFRSKFLNSQMNEKISLIGIPLDGSSQKITEEFRTDWTRMKKETEEILNILNSNKFNISINTVVHKLNINDVQNIYEDIIKYQNIQRWELHQFIPLSKQSQLVKKKLNISERDFNQAIENINNYKNIKISPKVSNKKSNFKYIDFNGDIVVIKSRNKRILNNIRDLDKQAIRNLLKNI